MEIQEISRNKLDEIIDNRDEMENYGLFYALDGDKVIAMDNTTGEAWTEEFSSVENAKKWLSDSSLTVDEVEDETEEDDLEEKFNKPEILVEDNAVKITLTQNIDWDIETDNDDFETDVEEVLDEVEIDDSEVSDNLLKYLKEYNFDDEFREVYNSVRRATVDIDYDKIRCVLELGRTFDREVIDNVFDDFISDVVLEDDCFSGSTTITRTYSHDVDVEDEYGEYERTVDVYDGEDEFEASYRAETVGEQEMLVEE